jgi:hypothetical protein
MNWLRSHYDQAALFLAAGLLLLSSLLIWRQTVHLSDRLVNAPSAPPKRRAGPLPKATEMEAAAVLLHHPAQWSFSGSAGLFVPERHFIGANGFPVPLQNTEVHPPVPNEWLEQYSLPIVDADVLEQDPDGDGFTNLNEWQFKTNPTDKNSHPPYLTKLKMRSFAREPFGLLFSSWVGDTFAINTIDLKEPTQFLRLGQTIRGTHFKLVKFKEKHEKNKYGTDVDVSELTLAQKETGEELCLVRERTAISPQSVASFVYTWGGKREFQVRKDHQFSLPPHREIKYNLIDVKPSKAVIVNTKKPDEPIEIGLFFP